MKKVYFLKTCDTCKRILKEVNIESFELQEIKTNTISSDQLEEMYNLAKSYEALFNKRARLYKSLDVKIKLYLKKITRNTYSKIILF